MLNPKRSKVMKQFLFIALLAFVPLLGYSQGLVVGDTDGTMLGGADTVLQVYTPQFFKGSTVITVGALYEKASSKDTLATVEVWHAVSSDGIAAGGKKVSTDATLRFGNSAATEYKEETITLSGGINYIRIRLNRIDAAADSAIVTPYLYIKR